MLLHLVDVTAEDPIAAWVTLRKELNMAVDLLTRLKLLPSAKMIQRLKVMPMRFARRWSAGAGEVLTISSVTGAGVNQCFAA